MKSIFSILINAYFVQKRLFDFNGGITKSRLLLVIYLLVDALSVQSSVSDILWYNPESNMGGYTLFNWNSMSCYHSDKDNPGGWDLACQGLTFIPSEDAAALLADTGLNIAANRKALLPLLTSWVPIFKLDTKRL